jgi:HTH-type transcriptional regulator / antitoxin HigA
VEDSQRSESAVPGDERDVLTGLVELYESKTLDIGNPDPVAAIRFRMEQSELTPRDLMPLVRASSFQSMGS